MPFVPVPNCAMIEIRMEMHNQQIENTLWFRNATGITASNLFTMADAVASWWYTDYRPLITNVVRLVEVYGRDMTTATGPQATAIPNTDNVGQKAVGSVPANVSLAVSFRTALTGRNYRGRNYVAGLAEQEVAMSKLATLTGDGFRTAYEKLIGNVIVPTGWEWVVASRYKGVAMDGSPIPRAQGEAHPVTSVTVVDYIVDSMRRRLPGRGK